MQILPPLETQDRMFYAMSYPLWFFLSWYVFKTDKKKDPFVLYNVFQGLFLGLYLTALFIISLVFFILIINIFPAFTFMIIVYMVFFLFFSVFQVSLWLFLASKSLKGELYQIPFFKEMVMREINKRFVNL